MKGVQISRASKDAENPSPGLRDGINHRILHIYYTWHFGDNKKAFEKSHSAQSR